ncbi:MAG: large conductance mechanosensitive channel protein MscL, partial [Clostridia bacterium]|nr:large conductance mechanosensitive channel protein MscL [Clostridia bacterium]
MKKFFSEFKAFIKKGNVVDLAVALIIGTAFNKIVSSLVNDVIMPLVSLMVGGKDVTDWKWVIQKAQYDANGNVLVAETALKYGIFIQAIIDFLIIALTVFIIVKIVKASTERIEKISKTIITEAKELTQKQIKALKKLQKNATKQAKKEGKSVDQVLEEKQEEIKAITEEKT